MTDKVKHNIRKGGGIFLSVWTVLVGIAFIIQVWRIYGAGGKPFTPERIGEHFRQIAVPVYIWIAAVVATGVFWIICPAPKQKLTPYVDLKCTLARLNKRLPEKDENAKKIAKNRLILQCAFISACICYAIVAFIYMVADYEMKAQNGFLAEHEEAERILRALVWIFAAIALAIVTMYFVEDRYKKEIAIAKSTIAENAKKGVKAVATEEPITLKSILLKKFAFVQSKWFVLGIRIAIALLGVTFIIIGITNGGMKAVLEKAINICSQCIGIG